MARFPAAPGAYGQPPVPPADELKQRTPASRPAATFARAVPRVSWKWNAICVERDAGRDGQPGQRRDLGRHADPDRVAEADLVDAEVEQPERDLDRARRLDAPRIRTAEGGRDVAAPPPTEVDRHARGPGAKAASDSSTVIPMLAVVNASVAAVKTAMASTPGRLGALQAAHVRDEDRIADAGRAREAGHQRIRVGELRDRPRGDEARRLDLAQAGVGQELDEARLGRGRDRERLVLEAVARPDLVDPDRLAHRVARASSDERRVHRPLDAGDLDLDPAEQLDGGDVLGAAVLARRSASGASRDGGRGARRASGAAASTRSSCHGLMR